MSLQFDSIHCKTFLKSFQCGTEISDKSAGDGIRPPLAFHCKNLPTNDLFSSMVVAAPFSDAGGHAQRKNRERQVEICTISQAFETHKESPACIGMLVLAPGHGNSCKSRNRSISSKTKCLKIDSRNNSPVTTQRVRRSYGIRIIFFCHLLRRCKNLSVNSSRFSPTAARTIFRCECHAKRDREYGLKSAAFS
jgi:hypothetical protein